MRNLEIMRDPLDSWIAETLELSILTTAFVKKAMLVATDVANGGREIDTQRNRLLMFSYLTTRSHPFALSLSKGSARKEGGVMSYENLNR